MNKSKETGKITRKITRNKMWPDTTAILRYRTRYGEGSTSVVEISARVDNLSAGGMFVFTEEMILEDTELGIQIQFGENIHLDVLGKILRNDKKGVAVGFTQIDTVKLCYCIMARMKIQ